MPTWELLSPDTVLSVGKLNKRLSNLPKIITSMTGWVGCECPLPSPSTTQHCHLGPKKCILIKERQAHFQESLVAFPSRPIAARRPQNKLDFKTYSMPQFPGRQKMGRGKRVKQVSPISFLSGLSRVYISQQNGTCFVQRLEAYRLSIRTSQCELWDSSNLLRRETKYPGGYKPLSRLSPEVGFPCSVNSIQTFPGHTLPVRRRTRVNRSLCPRKGFWSSETRVTNHS